MTTAPPSKPILCVDFDGVIHSYTSPWTNEREIRDPPVPGALRWLWEASKVFDVQIYSSRSKTHEGREAMAAWLILWSMREFADAYHPMSGLISPYPIGFAHEKPPAFLTIDDRALRFTGSFDTLDPAALLAFKPWNKG